jgi:hypothetical protein
MPIIKKHQSILDFATQYAGTAEALFDLAMMNGIGITDETAPGIELLSYVSESTVVNAFIKSGLDIAGLIAIAAEPGGIGYMQIENDFKVS